MKNLFTLFAFLICAFSASAQDVYFEENFNAGLPSTWTADTDWAFDTPAAVSSTYFTVPASADGNVAVWNDDGLGPDALGGGTVTTDAIDLTAATGTVYLTMNSYFPNLDFQGLDETAKINISTDMGATWTEIADLAGGETADFGLAFANLTDYIGETVMLQFVYDDGQQWNYGWAFDDVKISNEALPIPMFSYAISAGGSTIMNQALEGIDYHNDGYVFNFGFETITSYDLELSNGTDVITTTVTGVDIPFNSYDRYAIDEAITVNGTQTWTVTISNVNGNMDDDADVSDNSESFTLTGTSNVHPEKAVVVEEATGTWCQFCPRGAVYLDEMSKRFGDHFVGIAVHNGDPMVVTAYDNAIGPLIGGYPSVVYQREGELDPSQIVTPSLTDMQSAPPAGITIGAAMDGDMMTTSIEVAFLEDVTADHSVLIVLTEDDVIGDGGGWGQVNAYSGGGLGNMGGYELLPGTVTNLDYDHVARTLIGGFNGVSGIVVGDYAAGDVEGYIFDAANVADLNLDKVHVAGILLNGAGEVVNAKAVSVAEAMDNGLFTVSTNDVFDNTLANVFPNPVTTNATIEVSLEEAADVTITLVNALGQTVGVTNYGKLSGDVQVQFNMSDYAAGMYMMHVQADNRFFSTKLTKAN